MHWIVVYILFINSFLLQNVGMLIYTKKNANLILPKVKNGRLRGIEILEMFYKIRLLQLCLSDSYSHTISSVPSINPINFDLSEIWHMESFSQKKHNNSFLF
jgi:hypothetical protein